MVCVCLVPAIVWWFFLLRARTFLHIENMDGIKIASLSVFWDENAIVQLVDTIREVDYVPLERK
jgi:hypothetical protein